MIDYFKHSKACFYLIASLYLVFFLINFLNFYPWGIIPRTVIGLRGIILAPWFHGSLTHILQNSIPLFFLLLILKINFNKDFFSLLITLDILTGGLVWIFGSDGNHIGASGMVFALASFLIISSFFLKYWSLFLPLLIFFLFYSNLFLGLIPNINFFSPISSGYHTPNISYSSHWSGLIVGLVIGWKYSSLKKKHQKITNDFPHSHL